MAHYLDYPGLDYYTRRIKEQLAEKLEEYTSGAISKVFIYMGSVDNYEDLPTEGLVVGHVYNVVNAYPDKDIKAGDNVCWNGEDWDDLAGKVDTDSLITIEQAAANKQEVQDAIDTVTNQLENYILVDVAGEIIGTYLTWEDFLASFEVVTDDEVRALFKDEERDPDDANLYVMGDLTITDDFNVDGHVYVDGNITGSGTISSTGWIYATGAISATRKQNATLTSPHISISNGQTQFQGDSTVADGTVSVGGTGVSNNATCVVNCDMEIESSSYGVVNTGTFTVSDGVTINATLANVIGIYNYNGGATFTVSEGATINISLSYVGSNPAAIYNYNRATFTVNGAVTIAFEGNGYGINNYSRATFTVNGTVTITGTASGIYNYRGAFTVNGEVTINATESSGYGIYNYYSGSTFTVNGTVTITGIASGIYNSSSVTFTVSEGATINITANSYGIDSSNSATFTMAEGATINITANSYGIHNGGGTVRVSGVTINATNGIYNSTDGVTISGTAIINATGNYGIRNGSGTVTVSEGAIIDITTGNYGIDCGSGRVYVNGTVTITTDGTGVSKGSATISGSGTITVNGAPYTW